MTTASRVENRHASENEILTSATLRAAEFLMIRNKELAEIIGVSPSMVSKIKNGNAVLPKDTKTIELSKFFLRMYRSLDAIVGGNDTVAAAWLRNENTALDGVPIELISTIRGLFRVTAYLDQRRAPL
ncbi:MAG: antitoxin Xre/MbcA/ParS toxin-binding domain-containing protein [Pseudomonadota bacterium]